MEPVDFLKILRRRWFIIALAGLLGALAAWVTAPSASGFEPTPVSRSYNATTTLIKDPTGTAQLGFVALLAKGGRIPEVAAQSLDYQGDPANLAAQVSVTADDSLGTLSVSATGTSATATEKLADAYADAITTVVADEARAQRQAKVKELTTQIASTQAALDRVQAQLQGSPNDVALKAQVTAYSQLLQSQYSQLVALYTQAGNDSGLTVYQQAQAIPQVTGGGVFQAPSTRNGRVLLGLGVGLALGLLLALFVDRLDTRLRRRQEVEVAYNLPVVAEIPKLSRRERRRGALVTLSAPVGAAAEAYRGLRSALTLMPSHPLVREPGAPEVEVTRTGSPHVVLLTSAVSGEGKSTTAANLAVALAETGKQVLMLDSDFRNPSLGRLLDVAPGPGVADVLAGQAGADVAGLARPTSVSGVRLVTAGRGADRFHGAMPHQIKDLVDQARAAADIVVIDAAPALAGNDALDLMPYVDSVVVVSRIGRITDELAERCSGLLARMRVPVLGLALVGVTPAGADSGRVSRYGYGSSSSGASAGGHRRAKARSRSYRSA